MPKLPSPGSPTHRPSKATGPTGIGQTLGQVLALAELGLSIVPISLETKRPDIDWKRYQKIRPTEKQLRSWFAKDGHYLVGIVTGRISGVVVLDIDSPRAHAYWREQLGDVLDAAPHVQSPKAQKMGQGVGHYWFAHPGDEVANIQHHDDEGGVHWDIKGDGGIVVVPPSSGYEWVRYPVPGELPEMPEAFAGARPRVELDDGRQARSMLSKELEDLLVGKPGRNARVTRILGHYANLLARQPDVFFATAQIVGRIASQTPGEHPYDDTELEQTLGQAEEWIARAQADLSQRIDEDCGYLQARNDETLVQVRHKDDEGEIVYGMEHWGDFAIEARGLMQGEGVDRVYDVVLRRRGRSEVADLLPAAVLGDTKRLNGWLAGHGVSIIEPMAMFPTKGSRADRLSRFIESQNPPAFESVNNLGWHNRTQGFICHEGVLRADGLHPFENVKPHPRLRNWAPYHYGMVDEAEATEVLRQVLTFHDETVAAVFGAWWTACFLKPQIEARTSLFPFMALEAPSESGKTTGMFSMLIQLAGNTQGQTEQTVAALRDSLTAHRSGIVWVDDLSHTDRVLDLVRQATSGGSVLKKGEDNSSQIEAHLVAPFCLSGEGLPALRQEKALADRAIRLEVSSPTKRRSLQDPERMQYDDIVALRARYNEELWRVAGTITQLMLQRAEMVQDLPRFRMQGASGRWGDKMAILRLGAAILADVLDDPSFVERVDAWAAGEEDPGSENRLTLDLLPAAIAAFGRPERVVTEKVGHRTVRTPVVCYRGEWRFSPKSLADWRMATQGRASERTESDGALQQQAHALGLSSRRSVLMAVDGDRDVKVRMWKIPDELAERLVSRAEGSDRGEHPLPVPTPVHKQAFDLATTRMAVYDVSGMAHLPPDEIEKDLGEQGGNSMGTDMGTDS